MQNLLKTKIMKTRKETIDRIFLEENKLLDSNFKIGSKHSYNIDFVEKKISIKSNVITNPTNQVKVSSKTKKDTNMIIPVIDIKHPAIKKVFEGINKCSIELYEDEIVIYPAIDIKENNLVSKCCVKVINFLEKSKIIKSKKIAYSIKRSVLDIYLSKEKESYKCVNQLSLFDYGFELATDLETQSLYKNTSKSKDLQKEFNDVIATSSLLKGFTNDYGKSAKKETTGFVLWSVRKDLF